MSNTIRVNGQRRISSGLLGLWLMLSLVGAGATQAAQFQTFGRDEVHYVVVPSEFVEPAVAAQYGIRRGPDRAFVNISVLRDGTIPLSAEVAGSMINLLSQRQVLPFREVREGESIYYIAEFRHTDQDQFRFEIQITPDDAPPYRLEFTHKVYVER